jgi:formylglycine-generating enzyme required for sulfatase activity
VAKIRREPDFKPDCQRLADNIKKVLNGAAKPPVVPVPPSSMVHPFSPPVKKPEPATDPITKAALQRARDFAKTGKRNRDWTPFITTFNDLKIPDIPFCLVPTGTTQMGSNTHNGKPIHLQTFEEPFYIAQYPVTNSQWRTGVLAGLMKIPSDKNARQWYDDPNMANAPVVGITWLEAQQFAHWVGCRLLNEREWEYAARGIELLAYPWGNEWNTKKVVYDGNSGGIPWDVTSKPEGMSWVGAQHLSGNVWEWTASLYGSYPYPIDGSREIKVEYGTSVRIVLRGGSFYKSVFLRVSDRYSMHSSVAAVDVGFRLARSV